MIKKTLALALCIPLSACSTFHASEIPIPPLVEEHVEEVTEPKPFHELIEPLANLIAKGEGDWNAVNRGWAGDTPGGIQRLTGKTFENFTVGQVMDMQRRWLYAVGRYQFVPRALRFAVAHSDVNRLHMFTPETQNKLFAALIIHKRPGIYRYIVGQHNSLNYALRELAKEWASVEYFGYGRGRGYYNHVGGNRAHVTWRQAAHVLNQVRDSYPG